MRRVIAAALCLAATQACLVGRDLTFVEDGESAALASAPVDAGGDRDAPPAAADASPRDGGAADDVPPGFDLDAAIADKKDAAAQLDAGAGPKPDAGAPGACVGNREIEPNGLRVIADALPVGTMCGSIYRPGDIDKFVFDLGAGGRVKIRFDAEGDAYLFMEGDGKAYESGSGARYDFAGAGVWELDVRSPSGREQTFTIVRE